MKLYHHTLRRHLASIRGKGLLASKSRGKRKAVWLHTSALAAWACEHMLARRIGGVQNLVCIEVDVPREWLTRHGKGIYWCPRDVPPERLKTVTGYAVTAVVE